jgi:hypothetical protein
MRKLGIGQAALLSIGDQGHATPAHAADVNAFLVIGSFILQTQSILELVLFRGSKASKSLTGHKTGEKPPEAL